MFRRRNSSDAAIGWISTVDSLLLGFGLMLVLALHSAMTLRDGKGTDVPTVQLLEQREKTLEKLVAENAEQLASVSKDLDGTKKLLADSNNKVEETCRERDALKKEVNDTRAKLLIFNDRQKQANGNTAALSQEVDRLNSELADKSRNLQAFENELKTRDRDLLDAQENAAKAEASLKSAEGRLTREANAAATDVLGFKGRFENVVFIIDISHSMTHVKDPDRKGYKNAKFRPARWNRVKKEIVTWARNLQMKSLRVVLFHSDVMEHPGNGGFYGMEGEDRAASVAAIATLLEEVEPNLATNTLGAFEAAYEYPNIDTMILFTDGRPLVGGRDVDDVIADVQSLVRIHADIPVNVVGIGEYFEKSFADFLRDIADTTGGEFIGR